MRGTEPRHSAPVRPSALQETPRGAELALAVLFTTFAALLCVFPTSSADLHWHLLTGAEIWRRGALPQTDWFTYTSSDRPWIDLHWGFQLAVFWLHELGGVDLLILAKAAVVACASLLVWRLAGRGLGAARVALLLVPTAIVASGHADLRPGALSLLYLAAFVGLAERAEATPRLAFALAPLLVLWTNSQGLFALGLVVVAALVVDRVLRALARGRCGLAPLAPGALQYALVAAALAAAAPFANPWGLDGVLFPLELLRKLTVDHPLWAGVVEFQRPLDFARAELARGAGWGGLGAGFLAAELALAALAWASFVPLAARGRWSPFRLLVLGAFTWLAWTMLRNAGPFAIAAGAVLVANARELATVRTASHAAALRSSPREAAFAALVLALLVASVPAGIASAWAGDGRRLALGEARAWFVHGPARFACGPEMPGGAFVAVNGQAGVYLWHARGERTVFVDSRLEVPTVETFARFVEACERIAAADPTFEEIVRLPDGTLPVVILDSRYSRAEIDGLLALPSRWRLVFADASGAVFLDVPTAERLELPEVDLDPLRNPPLPI